MNINRVQRHYLLSIARDAVASELNKKSLIRDAAIELDLRFFAPTFVTLSIENELRGCVGSLDATRSVAEDIIHNAKAAAFHDPRFIEVTADELEKISFEISILSKATKVKFDSEPELFSQIEIGLDGVIIESGLHRATFLPCVWAQLPTHIDFFDHLKRKANSTAETPVTDFTVCTYRTETFSDERPVLMQQRV
jgi:AmmeMemoRadiSam system protein A